MSVSSYTRGWKIIWNFIKNAWFYADTEELMKVNAERPCKKCGKLPTPEGYDACLEYIEGAESACCGHGVIKPFVRMKTRR